MAKHAHIAPPEIPETEELYPNKPSGFTTVAEADMTERFLWPQSTESAIHGSWWEWEYGNPRTILYDEPAPQSHGFFRTHYEEGRSGGTAPVNWGGWDGHTTEYEEIYFSQWIRLVGDDFESHPVGTKLGFFGVGEGPEFAANEGFFFLQSGLRESFWIRFNQQGTSARNLNPNVYTGPVIFAGEWHHLEMYGRVNDIGQENGVMQMWVDGRLVVDYDDVIFRNQENPWAWYAYKCNPTWGGAGYTKSRDDYIDVSHTYIAGR